VLLADLPDSDLYAQNHARLVAWSQAVGMPLEILPLHLPRPRQADGFWLPASYANFYLVNGAVLLPVFGDAADTAAARLLESCFPGRDVVCIPADQLVFGLGALHCLSQQEPA
jgi:agmatine deiminase